MEGKSYHYRFLCIGLFLCLFQNVNGQTSRCTVRRLYSGGFLPDGKMIYNNGEHMTFYCNDGYEREHDTRYWCDSGNAVPSIPNCINTARSCSAPDLQVHMTPSRPRFPHGMLLGVSCEHGFELSTSQELPRCHQGRWNRPLTATCQRASCSAPDLPDHMTPSRSRFSHGTLLDVSCEHGFQLSRSQGLPRCHQGVWSGSITATCQRASCSAPDLPDHMTPSRSRFYHGMLLGVSCEHGFQLSTSQGLPRCYKGGWIGSVTATCQRVSCGHPANASHSTIEILPGVQGYLHGTRVRYSCSDGWEIEETAERECVNGQWIGSTPECRPRVRIARLCPRPGYISRVVQYVNGLETNHLATYPHDELPEGTFLVSRCSLPGEYVLRGSANRTCFDGGWTGEQPRCVNAATRISFQNNQPLEVRSDGTIVIHPRGQLYIYCRIPYYSNARAIFESDNQYGPTAEYWDNYGPSTMVMSLNTPRTSHSGRFTCRSDDSTLSHTVHVQFAEIYCDSPTAPTNGEIQDYDNGWRHELYYMGKEITFTCNDDYTLNGARRMTCVFGEWSHPVPTCKRATCEELHPPTHGIKMGGNRVGDSVLIGCNQGYQLQGEPFLDCQESGNWSHPLPACVAQEPVDVQTPGT
ncbi:sushi, von Willebrand factor type A, EGF and pentraxin domain-containing protein 1-like isoform X1 [Strongylocentrotus purpuratus]|uniref:Sushi domain-containing protein n=1 Tax=Strongylocentrotus purpuratus TaxID=7668 RepID=A0A7M7PBM8_STRPU|nr:sushi, von Willebrand factor type A, EGF and pentraxin domain-containing protein 1-like isoform X1 [Strongylocentrotus purpuratus]